MKAILDLFKSKTKSKENSHSKSKKDNTKVNQSIKKNNSQIVTQTIKGNKGGIISNLNSLTENKGISDNSTKIVTKDGIDYIFSSWKSLLLSDNKSDNIDNPKEIISDLENTLEINLNLLENTVNQVIKNDSEKLEIKNKLMKLNEIQKIRNKLKNKKSDIRGNNLISSLIHTENIRKIEEMLSKHKSQIADINECSEGKLENMRSLEKKLKEYEKYVHKHSKNSNESRFFYLKTFDILDFTETNINLVEQIEANKKSIEDLKNYIDEVKDELNKSNHKENNDSFSSQNNKKLKKLQKIYFSLINKQKEVSERKSKLEQLKMKAYSLQNNNIIPIKIEKTDKNEKEDHMNKIDETYNNDFACNNTFEFGNVTNVTNITRHLPKDFLDITYIPKK